LLADEMLSGGSLPMHQLADRRADLARVVVGFSKNPARPSQQVSWVEAARSVGRLLQEKKGGRPIVAPVD